MDIWVFTTRNFRSICFYAMGVVALYALNRLLCVVCAVLMAAWCTTEYRYQADVYGQEMLQRASDMSDKDADRVFDSMVATSSIKKRTKCNVAAPPPQPHDPFIRPM